MDSPGSNISIILWGEKVREKMEENPKKKKNKKELGLVVSQQTVILHPAKTQLPQKGKNLKKEKKTKKN